MLTEKDLEALNRLHKWTLETRSRHYSISDSNSAGGGDVGYSVQLIWYKKADPIAKETYADGWSAATTEQIDNGELASLSQVVDHVLNLYEKENV